MYTLTIATLVIPIVSIYFTIKFTLLENNLYENLLKSTDAEFNRTSITLIKSLTRHLIDVISALLPAIKIIIEYKNMEKYILKTRSLLSKIISILIKFIIDRIIMDFIVICVIICISCCILSYISDIHEFFYQRVLNDMESIFKIIKIVYDENPLILIGSLIVIISPFIILLFIRSLISASYKYVFFIISFLYLFKNIGFLGF